MSIYLKKNIHNAIIEILLTKFLPYRNLELIETEFINKSIIEEMRSYEALLENKALSNNKILSNFNDMIINNIKNAGYVQIEALKTNARGDRNLVVFLILSDDERQGDIKKNKNIKKIIDTLSVDKDNNLDELIIIAEKSQFSKSAFIKIIAELKKNEKLRDFSGERAIYNAYPYHNFIIDIPNHIMVPSHRIMTDEEIQNELYTEYIKKGDIYTIYEYDPPIIWLGGKDGQIVEIIRKSITSLEAPVYRLIKAELYKPDK